MERSSAATIVGGATRVLCRARPDGAPVYSYEPLPGVPPVGLVRFLGGTTLSGDALRDHAHAHDFLLLVLFRSRWRRAARGSSRMADRRGRRVHRGAGGGGGRAGRGEGLERSTAWAVFFTPDVLQPHEPRAFRSRRTHPLLFPFVGASAGGAQRLNVPSDQRAGWVGQRFAALEDELRPSPRRLQRGRPGPPDAPAGRHLAPDRRCRRSPPRPERAVARGRVRVHRDRLSPLDLAGRRRGRRRECRPVTSPLWSGVEPGAQSSSGSPNGASPTRAGCSSRRTSRSPRSARSSVTRIPATSSEPSSALTRLHRSSGAAGDRSRLRSVDEPDEESTQRSSWTQVHREIGDGTVAARAGACSRW